MTRGGRSGRAALVPGVLLALVAGCADVNAPAPVQDEAAVSWMEWPTEIAFPGTSPSVRLVGYRSGCGTFRIDATVTEYNQVQLRPYEEREENQPCPLYDIIGIYDTIVALPPLPATTPRTPFVLMAPTYDYFGTLSTPVFGTFYLVGIVGDTTRRVGGRAELVADSLGCSWAYAQMPFINPFMQGRTMVLDTLIDLGAARRFAFVRGSLLPASPPRCGQSRALRVESALIEYP
jgi:hypothetical protein